MEFRSIESVVKALNEAGVEYIIVGGVAVNAHGFVRMTRDLDIVVRLDQENIALALNTLFDVGYQMAIPASAEDFATPLIRDQWRSEKNMIVLKLWSDLHRRTPIDIFVYEPFEFAEEIQQLIRMDLSPGVSAPIVSLKTLLAMKREADRPQDHIDIEELQRIE
ncbi:MAG: nucleotidyl transferase AbiEii/AbiGii toxin family protein [Luteolibacter sp.]